MSRETRLLLSGALLRPSGVLAAPGSTAAALAALEVSPTHTWVVLQIRVEVSLLLWADAVRARGASDHAPVDCNIAGGVARGRRSSPVPRSVLDSDA